MGEKRGGGANATSLDRQRHSGQLPGMRQAWIVTTSLQAMSGGKNAPDRHALRETAEAPSARNVLFQRGWAAARPCHARTKRPTPERAVSWPGPTVSRPDKMLCDRTGCLATEREDPTPGQTV